MATIQAIQTLVAAVAAGFTAGGKLADALYATFEPSKTVELCRAVYGDDFALVQRMKKTDGKPVQVKLTAAQELDHARYQAIAYACRVLVARGQWPKATRAGKAGKAGKGKGKGKDKDAAGHGHSGHRVPQAYPSRLRGTRLESMTLKGSWRGGRGSNPRPPA